MTVELRTIRTPAEQALSDTYTAARSQLPGKGALAKLREDAFRRFSAIGLPHRRIEEWKYTDLRTLMRDAKPLAGMPDAATKELAREPDRALAGIDFQRLVFVDGTFAAELSDMSPVPGLTIGSMSGALSNEDPLVAAHVGKVIETDDVAVALNTALMGDGAIIRIAGGTHIKQPILLDFIYSSQPSSVFLRSLIVVEAGARASIVENHRTSESQINTALELVVGDGAEVDYLKIVRAQAIHIGTLMSSVGAQARFNTFNFTLGGLAVRNQNFVRFDGEGTIAGIRGATLLRGKEHVDNTLLIDHAAGACQSREQFRSVLDGESRGIFQGKIIVRPHAQKTDAKMASNALLVSDEAEADNKPELEIFADDVQCGHGATAGAIDESLKFYLMARGIPEKEAEALLIQAFVGEAIDEISLDGLRDALLSTAAEWLRERT
ncbi:MAG TPA: Fe-S cluster assembly protein SufD [Pseudolabrys sp.]|jgi:Fe-S cluster assembly protein SufD|nr:Fe-S cluster assembly protein SufD [Pseudolabrys sp.]